MLSLRDHGPKGNRLSAVLLGLALGVYLLPFISVAQDSGKRPTLNDVFSRSASFGNLGPVQAVITYVDPKWRVLLAQDETTGCLIQQVEPRWDFNVGDRVSIEGYRLDLMATNPVHALRDATVRRVGKGERPRAAAVSAAGLVDPAFAAVFVEVKGTVRSIVEMSRLMLVLSVEGKSFGVWVRHHEPSDLAGLLDAEVTVQGCCNQQKLGADGRTVITHLMVGDFTSIRVGKPGPREPFALPRTPISQLPAPANEAQGRQLIQGRVVDQERGVSLALRDDTGEILVLSPQQITLAKDELVEAIGFPGYEKGTNLLRDAQFRVINLSLSSSPQVVAAQANPELPLLTSIKQVLDLSREQARQEYPLRLQGVVTHCDVMEKMLFLQAGDHGIYVNLYVTPEGLPSVKAGQLIEVSGVTQPGGVLNMISPARITVLGDTSLPPAMNMSYQTGITGAFDSRRVKVQGLVQSTTWADNYLNMDLVANDGRFWCIVPASSQSPLRTNLLNASVEVEAVCILTLDRLMRPSGVELRVQREDDIRILENASTNAFGVHERSIGETLGFLPPPQGNQRVKVTGLATYWSPGRELYVEDASGAICALVEQTNPVELGDAVEVLGFRALSETGVLLRNAEYRVVGKGQLRSPSRLRASEALSLANRDRLVQIDALLQRDVPPSVTPELVLEDGQELFTARLEPLESGQLWPAWHAGSQLRVTGICLLRLDQSREPRAFRLLVRGPADIAVLKSPPWFTKRRIVAISVLLLVTVVVALSWVVALRARVAKQTDLIRQRLESEAAAERRLALVWESSADGMRMTDAMGIVAQVNQAYCEMTKKTRPELEGKPYWEAFQTANGEALLTEYQDRFRQRIAPPRQEMQTVLWNGQAIWLDCTHRFIERRGSSPLLLSQFRDITERKSAEEESSRLKEQLLQAQKTESIGRLAGGVAHDFNNMLQVILGNTMLALEEIPAESPLHEAMQQIKSSAQRSADLTRQLLTFARKQTINPKVLDLNDRVAALLRMLQRLIGENIELIWVPGRDVWPVKMDPVQVDQVLVNLCVNARDAITHTGSITIQTANARFDEAEARAQPDGVPGDYVRLTIHDTGHGMDAATREHLFEPFFTTKEVGKGTGLGLATVFGIVKQNRGFLDVRSEPNAGATFSLYLPRCENQSPQPVALEQQTVSRGHETILLVEDEEQVLNYGRRALTQCGYRVLAAQNPDAALELAQRHAEQIQLLITDVIMPGMNGKALKDKITALKPAIRCIFMSGYTSDVLAPHGVMEEGMDYLQKPFTIEALSHKVREVLERRG